MSYVRKLEFRIVPRNSYEIHRNCGGCGKKSLFQNSGNFRVNANGNKVDVWLIYQCKKCKHTYNLTIYERKDPGSIGKNEYEGFLSNSDILANKYGRDISLFVENRAEICKSTQDYVIRKICETEDKIEQDMNNLVPVESIVVFYNEEKVKVRYDLLLSKVLDISRNQIQQLMKNEKIICREDTQHSLIEIKLCCDVQV